MAVPLDNAKPELLHAAREVVTQLALGRGRLLAELRLEHTW